MDVDDTQYHGSALDKRTGEVIDFKCRQTLQGLLSQLEKLIRHFPGCTLKLCYEASYIGFILSRDVTEKGYACEVVAPTSIRRPRCKQIKTDRIDASQLAHSYGCEIYWDSDGTLWAKGTYLLRKVTWDKEQKRAIYIEAEGSP